MAVRVLACVLAWLLAGLPGAVVPTAAAQSPSDWYDPSASYVRIAVAEDGVVEVPRTDLAAAGLPSTADPASFRLFENGAEIPLEIRNNGDAIRFVGQRNRGTDELWAYDGNPDWQSSDYYSLYTDTTYYWLTWGGPNGLRYQDAPGTATSVTSTLRDTLHTEQDDLYYLGRAYENGSPLYTPSEGYYWHRFRHNSTGELTFETTLAVGRRTASGETMNLAIRLDTETSSCHRVTAEAELTSGWTELATVEWRGYARETIRASVSQSDVPSTGLPIRLTSKNTTFTDSNCPDPSTTPNYVLLDYIETVYTRSLEAVSDAQELTVPSAGNYTFAVEGYTGSTVTAYNPVDGERTQVSASGGSATVNVSTSAADAPVWVVSENGIQAPAAVLPETTSNWSTPSAHGADYILLTTQALLPSAQRMADFRRTQSGYEVAIVNVQDVFDEFDYGRPTPIAIRRFVRATQSWQQATSQAPNTCSEPDTPACGAPRFLAIWGDGQYPIDDGSVEDLRPEWNVPSYGFSPSDGWFAMQADGPDDWSEILAVGRIPIRSNAQGDLFIQKIQTHEQAPPAAWKKRMLLLAGGTSASEQSSLQFYSDRWGQAAYGTADSLYAAGMDTLRFYKQASDALDTSFQDSLAAELEQGAAWLNYFGHSAALTWEIVTDPPANFNNAGRLPVVISLGCRTGSFAGGLFEQKNLPSFGEQLVVGTTDPSGTPRDGSLNGGIAHWGTSALGNRLPSARLNEELVDRVFVSDTLRVLGEAIRRAKADVAANFGRSTLYVRHLLQYGLLGDPATRIPIADQPDLHVSESDVAIRPDAPTPSEDLDVTVTLRNFGLVPRDSVNTTLTWEQADGSSVERRQRIPRFALEQPLDYSFPLDDAAVGTNTFRFTADPENTYAETNETDNSVVQTKVVFDAGLELVTPVDQARISTPQPDLQVNVIQQSAAPTPVVVQLDTVSTFDSAALQETTLSVEGVSGTWTLPDALPEGTYFWRARLDDPDRPNRWETAAFTVRPNTSLDGWMQAGRLFDRNTQENLERPGPNAWAFTPFNVRVQAFSELAQGGGIGFKISGVQNYEVLQFGFQVLVINGTTGAVRASNSFPTYDLTDRYVDETGEQQTAINNLGAFLDDKVQEGDYVFVSTRHLARQSDVTIPESVRALFRNLGTGTASAPYTTAIDTIDYRDLWTLRARKGDPAATREQAARRTADQIQVVLEEDLSFRRAVGTTFTPRIGPATQWDALQWTAAGDPDTDSLTVQVLSADSTVLIDDLQALNGTQSLDQIDAAAHPYLYLRGTFNDAGERTPAQLQEWSVAYRGVPELVVDPVALQSVADTLDEGATAAIEMPVTNLGPVPSGEVRVRYELTDRNNATTTLAIDTLTAIGSGETATSQYTFDTQNRPGRNRLTVTAETDNLERVSYNNTALRTAFVRADTRPPALRVLVNGRELQPVSSPINDFQDPRLPFVSATPELEILLSDENEYFALDDTSYVAVYLKGGLPTDDTVLGSPYRRIPFSGSDLTFSPPDDSAPNEARIRFTPTLTGQDSTYTMKVEAQDANNNELEPYQVSFRVQTDQVIRDLYPYPNPMSTHTTFAFRVEGGTNETLRNFRVRIYTLSGRLIRELDESDLQAPLSVGWNQVRWDGRDADGDRVATGVYLYRVHVEGDQGTFRGDVEKVAVIR